MPKLSVERLEAAAAGHGLDGCVDPTLSGVFDTQQLLELFRPPEDGGGSSSALPCLDPRGALFEELATAEFEDLQGRVGRLRDEYFAIKASVVASIASQRGAPPNAW